MHGVFFDISFQPFSHTLRWFQSKLKPLSFPKSVSEPVTNWLSKRGRMAVDYDHRDAILNAQASPAHSVSVLLRPLKGAGRFCDHVLGVLGNHVSFVQRDAAQPQSEPLVSTQDLYIRWAQLVSVIF